MNFLFDMADIEFLKILVEKNYITEDWVTKFPDLFIKFKNDILPVLQAETNVVYPQNSINIFEAFKQCPVDQIKVVIFLQDPYHDGSATGVALDNLINTKKMSPSLKNVMKEIQDDVGVSKRINKISYLEHLPPQGVLLINSALTVVKGKPLSHMELWKDWTELLVNNLNTIDNISWILWGNFAKSYKSRVTNTTHTFVEGVHPSPFSASKFFGGKYFSKINEILKRKKLKQIKW